MTATAKRLNVNLILDLTTKNKKNSQLKTPDYFYINEKEDYLIILYTLLEVPELTDTM